jgi:hypothetical protein
VTVTLTSTEVDVVVRVLRSGGVPLTADEQSVVDDVVVRLTVGQIMGLL